MQNSLLFDVHFALCMCVLSSFPYFLYKIQLVFNSFLIQRKKENLQDLIP